MEEAPFFCFNLHVCRGEIIGKVSRTVFVFIWKIRGMIYSDRAARIIPTRAFTPQENGLSHEYVFGNAVHSEYIYTKGEHALRDPSEAWIVANRKIVNEHSLSALNLA